METRWQLDLQDVQSSSQIIATNEPTADFLQSGCPSRRPTNSVKALKENGIKTNGEWKSRGATG